MRIVLVGAIDFTSHCLKETIQHNGHEVTVLTLPRESASFHSDYADLSEVASANNLCFHHIKNINDPTTVALIKTLEPDLIFVFGWSQIISKEVLDLPRLGCIGTHPALLPRNRGRHPLVWALVEGLEETGLTFFYLDEGVDSGDILWQQPCPITFEDDAESLYEKIKGLATKGINEFLPLLATGASARHSQDHSQVSYWRKRGEKDGEIDWASQTMTNYNLIRALTHPYVGAHTFLDGRLIKIWKSAPLQDNGENNAVGDGPGTVVKIGGGGFDVVTGDGVISVSDYEFTKGGTLKVGNILGSRG